MASPLQHAFERGLVHGTQVVHHSRGLQSHKLAGAFVRVIGRARIAAVLHAQQVHAAARSEPSGSDGSRCWCQILILSILALGTVAGDFMCQSS